MAIQGLGGKGYQAQSAQARGQSSPMMRNRPQVAASLSRTNASQNLKAPPESGKGDVIDTMG
jgi:hypothetical protein